MVGRKTQGEDMAHPYKSRGKIIVELVLSIVMVLIGAVLMAEGWDITPEFQITNWAALIFGLLIGIVAWQHVRDAWNAL
jgi:predicted tellurium resistance membrane protein TerC